MTTETYCSHGVLHSFRWLTPKRDPDGTVRRSGFLEWAMPCSCRGDASNCTRPKSPYAACDDPCPHAQEFASRDNFPKVEEAEDGRLVVHDWGSISEMQQRLREMLAGEPYETGPLKGPWRGPMTMMGARRGPSDLLSAPASYAGLLERAAGIHGGVDKRRGNVAALTEYATQLAAIMGRDPRADDEVELVISPPALTYEQLARITELVNRPL
jgi:hypothetical protein